MGPARPWHEASALGCREREEGGRPDLLASRLRSRGVALACGGAYSPQMQNHAQVIKRWRDLRAMLIEQLDMFETGALTLRSNGVNISADAVSGLKREILE